MMSHHKRFFRFLLFAVFLFFFTFRTGVCFSAIWYVDGDLPASGSGTSWPQAFKSIQEAVDAASADNEIWVKKGTYAPSVAININRPVAIYGGFGGWETEMNQRDWATNVTTLDGHGSLRHCFHITADASIDGFTITRGNARPTGESGGAIMSENSSVRIQNCIFTSNRGKWGAAIYNLDSSVSILNCIFTNNSGANAGAICIERSSASIGDCVFRGNSGLDGGAINSLASSANITNCRFEDNYAGEKGGGIINWDWSYPGRVGAVIVTNCTFFRNYAGEKGGGFSGWGGIFTNCNFFRNYAGERGGGFSGWGGIFTNCNFFRNDSGEFGGAGVYAYASTFTNCIFWGNCDLPGGYCDGGIDIDGSSNVVYSDIQGGYPGEGNIDTDPLFFDPGNGDFHLSWGSPCIDTGTRHAPNLPDSDFEGDPRIIGLAPDMGADEFVPPRMGMENLILYISNLDLPKGIANSLVSIIEAARKSLDNGKAKTAINQLNAFVNKVEAQRGKKISDDEAEELMAKAQRIIDSI